METGNNDIPASRLYFENLAKDFDTIPVEKKSRLNDLVIYLRSKLKSTGKANILFISPYDGSLGQMGQLWAKTGSLYHGLPIEILTGSRNGNEINPYALTAIRNRGFEIKKIKGGVFPVYSVRYADAPLGIKVSSMPLEEAADRASGYVAMVINQREWESPLLKHAEFRFPLTYDIIPKEDDHQKYNRLFHQIGVDMSFIFSRIREG